MTHMGESVGVRELRQNLSKYLDRVKEGESLVVTERGREVARLVPSGATSPSLLRLIEMGATVPTGRLSSLGPPGGRAATGVGIQDVLDDTRADRI